MESLRTTNEKSRDTSISDPTANVIALVESNARAADALRQADIKFTDAQHAHLKEMTELRATHADALNIAETKRIDAIRAVDVGAVATAADRAGQQATVLANQVVTSAETLRTLVASTATAMAQAAQQFQSQVTERLALLERSQYKGEGRSGIADPQMTEFAADIKAVLKAQQTGGGESKGMRDMWGWIVAAAIAGAGLFNLIGDHVSR